MVYAPFSPLLSNSGSVQEVHPGEVHPAAGSLSHSPVLVVEDILVGLLAAVGSLAVEHRIHREEAERHNAVGLVVDNHPVEVEHRIAAVERHIDLLELGRYLPFHLYDRKSRRWLPGEV